MTQFEAQAIRHVAHPDSRILVGGAEAVVTEAFASNLRKCGYRHVDRVSELRRLGDVLTGSDADLVVLGATPGGGDLPSTLAGLRRTQLEEHPVMVLTAGTSPQLMRDLLEIGVSECVASPFDMSTALWRASSLIQTGRALRCARRALSRLEADLEATRRRLDQEEVVSLARLARVIDYADDDLSQHGRRVAVLAGKIATKMGLSQEHIADITRAARLHDVGKVVVPDAVLEFPGPLSPYDMAQVRAHANVGALVLSGGSSRLVQMAEQIAWAHHERWDGTGYPRGLAGEAIPLEARIVAVADSYDAMVSHRPYRPSITAEEALHEVANGAGSQFDPTVVRAFIAIMLGTNLDPDATQPN